MILEILGYIGMAITLYAFSRESERDIRVFTLIGALATTIYCILKVNIPVAILNGSLVIMNAYYLLIKEKI